MFEIGIEKILLILVVVLLLFGAKRIPEIGQSLGKGIREFRRSMSDIHREVAGESPAESAYAYPPATRAPTPPPPRQDGSERSSREPKRLL
jgi:sec-independent protein translocase protein TatA